MRDMCDRERLEALAATLPKKTFYGRQGPYLTRYVLHKMPGGGQVNLHYFHRSDEDEDLHNHPWSGRSLILIGGYEEERLSDDGQVVRRFFLPGDTNIIEPQTFHRVDLLSPEGCWTLFTLGKKVQDWGFWDRKLGAYWPWREYIELKGLDPIE